MDRPGDSWLAARGMPAATMLCGWWARGVAGKLRWPPRGQLQGVVGAQAHGQAVSPYVDRWISISQYPLSAACVLSRITGALEDVWGIS